MLTADRKPGISQFQKPIRCPRGCLYPTPLNSFAFIDGGDCYYELEVNALNTVYEVFFIWRDAYTKGSRFDIPLFDVHHPHAYTFGGNYDRSGASFWKGTHSRGIRWAFTNFDMPGLQTATRIEGTVNDNRDIDKGWSLEIAIP